MSLRSRLSTANSENVHDDHIRMFKTYSFTYQDEDKNTMEESGFDEDDDLSSKYLEKEIALKKVNEELEKKTNEIFRRIEKYRSGDEISNNMADEIGQGDAYHDNGIDFRFPNFRPKSSQHEWTSPPPNGFNGNYSNLSRSSSSDADVCNKEVTSHTTSSSSERRRPATATAGLTSYPNYSASQTESTLRRAETARPVDGIEEKHQIRLQKATESVLKCVQSKLVNYEHRLADMHLQYRQKIQENTMLEAKVKALDDDRKRLLKSIQALQSTTDKFSKSAETTKMNLNLKLQAFASLRKEMDSLKRDLKQKSGMIQSLQTRLDRCTEENRRLKSQHQSSQTNMRQQQNEDRSSMDELKQRVVQLEQQKISFQTTIEKQAQLIKSLRNQKVCLTNIVHKNKIKVENWFEFSDVADENNLNLEVKGDSSVIIS